MSYYLINCLRLLKQLYDFGVYQDVAGEIHEIGEDDLPEIFLNGLDCLAPEFEEEPLGEDVCCGSHTLYHFSSRELREYYYLCWVYERLNNLTPETNPYVNDADNFIEKSYRRMDSYFGHGFDNDIYVKEFLIEVCPEHPFDECDIFQMVHDVMEYYRVHVESIRAAVMKGPVVLALPPHAESERRAAYRQWKEARKRVDSNVKKHRRNHDSHQSSDRDHQGGGVHRRGRIHQKPQPCRLGRVPKKRAHRV